MSIERRAGFGPLLDNDPNYPGLVMDNGGFIYLVKPDGTRCLLDCGGGTGNTPDPTAIGDMLYSADGLTWTLLGIGSQDDVLTADGGIPVWEPGGTSVVAGDALSFAGSTDVLDVLFDGITIDVNGSNELEVITSAVLTDAVIVDPATSVRNLIQPTGDFIPLTARGFAGQTNPLFVTEDSAGNDLVRISSAGVIEFGTANDTNLYRAGANSLKTDDAFTVALAFSHLGTTFGALGATPVVQQAASTFAGLWTALKNYGFLTGGSTSPGEFTDAVIILPTTSARNVIQPSGAAVIPLTVKGFAAQSANLQEWQDSTSAILTSIGSGGKFLSTVTGEFSSNGTAADRGLIVSQHSTGINAALLYFQKSRGTKASPTAVVNGDVVGSLGFAGYDGDEYIPTIASITGAVTGVVSNNVIPTSVFINTGTAVVSSQTPQGVWYHTGLTGIGRGFGDVVGGITAPLATLHVNTPSTFDVVSLRVENKQTNPTTNLTEWYNAFNLLTSISATGVLQFGSTSDTNLYRTSANVLKTDDAFHVALAFSHLGTTAGFFAATPVVQQAASTISALWTGLKNYGLLTSGSVVPVIPGTRLDMVSITTSANSTATTAATAVTAITSSALSYDGVTRIRIYLTGGFLTNNTAAQAARIDIWDGSTDLGVAGVAYFASALSGGSAVSGGYVSYIELTPSAGSHTFTARIWNSGASTGTWSVGAGGAGVTIPGRMIIEAIS